MLLEFKDLWHQLPVPDAVDLARQLEADGLSAANLVASTSTSSTRGALGGRGGRGRGKGKAERGRKSKLQNTHLADVDLTKDYTAT